MGLSLNTNHREFVKLRSQKYRPMVIFRPRIMITVPYGITSVETRAVHEAGLGAGSGTCTDSTAFGGRPWG